MINIEHLTKTFSTPKGKLTVLNDFNLTVDDGTFLGLQGKSGAGKSTLLSLIAGLQKADSGSIAVDGKDISAFSEKEAALFRNTSVGFISQEQSFLENLTVYDNVRLPAYICKLRDFTEEINQRALTLLEEFGIAHLALQYPQNLSGGENHRILIARGLINNPHIILADEPTDSVDEERSSEIIRLFKAIASEGKIVILVSHNSDALRLCDQVVTL